MLIDIKFDLPDSLFDENFYFDDIDMASHIAKQLTAQIAACSDPIASFQKTELVQLMAVINKALAAANGLKVKPDSLTRSMQNHAKRILSEASSVITTEKQNRKKTNELNRKKIMALSSQKEAAAADAAKAKREAKKYKIAAAEAKEAAIKDLTRKAGRAKQSPYEKAGTIAAVNALLAENVDELLKRGGKAELNRRIINLIAHGDIPAPNEPTPKTVDAWIDNFKKTLSS